jgi:ammonium transporter Rh
MSAFIVSRLTSEHKFDVVHIQNSTLAGGVVMGVAADLALHPTAAMAAGFVAGAVSVLGYHYLTPFLSHKFNIQDICGVHNLHGMPGVLSCIVGIFGTLHAAYSPSKYPENSSDNHKEANAYNFEHKQALWQAIGLFITLGVSIVGGLFAGLLLRQAKKLRTILARDYFNDRTFWNLPTDYDTVINPDDEKEEEEPQPEPKSDLQVVVDKPKSAPKKANHSGKSSDSKNDKRSLEMDTFKPPARQPEPESESEDSLASEHQVEEKRQSESEVSSDSTDESSE